MPPKKGKGKAKKSNADEADTLRLSQLHVLEAEAEDFQRCENERRTREEQEERANRVRDEQIQQMREKDRALVELNLKLNDLTNAMQKECSRYQHQVEQLSSSRDAVQSEMNLLRAEWTERERLMNRARQNSEELVARLQANLNSEEESFESQITRLQSELRAAKAELEVQRQVARDALAAMDRSNEVHEAKVSDLEGELTKARTVGRSLQEVLEARDLDDQKNISIIQLLNAQLDESKRHSEQRLEEERRIRACSKEEILRLESECAHLREEVKGMRAEESHKKRSAEEEWREYQQQLEQVRFDSEYLKSEIVSMRNRCSEAERAADALRGAADENSKKFEIELDALRKNGEDLKALLYRKEKEYFDRVTFLNAQVSNNRTVIAQLQQKLQGEREAHTKEVERRAGELQKALDELSKLSASDTAQAEERRLTEERLQADISALKVSTIQLQASLDEKERTFGSMCFTKDDEIARLRDILDAHFIPYREEMGLIRKDERKDALLALVDKVTEKTHEAALKERAALERETWLKSRITNLNHIVESLQQNMKQSELLRFGQIRSLEDEVARLKKILEIHSVPYSM